MPLLDISSKEGPVFRGDTLILRELASTLDSDLLRTDSQHWKEADG